VERKKKKGKKDFEAQWCLTQKRKGGPDQVIPCQPQWGKLAHTSNLSKTCRGEKKKGENVIVVSPQFSTRGNPDQPSVRILLLEGGGGKETKVRRLLLGRERKGQKLNVGFAWRFEN